MVSDLGVIAAEPNWPIMLPFGILLLALRLYVTARDRAFDKQQDLPFESKVEI